MAEHTCKDPRRPDAELEVEFDIDSYGSSPAPGYYAGCAADGDGDPPEISITAARDVTGANIFDLLTEEQKEKLWEEILSEYDFDPGDPFDYEY